MTSVSQDSVRRWEQECYGPCGKTCPLHLTSLTMQCLRAVGKRSAPLRDPSPDHGLGSQGGLLDYCARFGMVGRTGVPTQRGHANLA